MQKDKAAVFILLGQSNAVGHATPMKEEDKILTPMKNVFGLSRDFNQSIDTAVLKWSGYTSFGMNLAEEQDNTYSLANCLAKLWQNEIDSGNPHNLPDLYIVQIAIGAQGVTEGYMWHPDYEKILIPGVLGKVKIALTPFTNHILSLLKDSFDKRNTDFEVFGLHWRGSENDSSATWECLETTAKKIHAELFDGFCKSIGKKVPVILHRRVAHDRCMDFDPSGESLKKLHYINKIFDELSEENDNISVFDVRENCPYYIPEVRGNGLFLDDVVHFTPEVNQWVSEGILNEYKKTLDK